jgi:SAM-dependent methyltransferase
VSLHPMALNVNTRIRWDAIKDLECVKSLSGKRLLEVGCGLGFFCMEFGRQGAEVLGVDVDQHALDYVSGQCNMATRLMDVETEPLPAGPWDCIFVGEVLEHVDDPGALIGKVGEALSPDGTAIVTTPALEGWLARTRGKQLAHEHGSQKHERIGFSKGELEALAYEAGLDLVEHRYCVFTFAELFMQLTKLSYLASKKTYEGQSDVLAMADTKSFKMLKLIFPLLWAVFRLESAVCKRLGLSGHCHVLVVRKRNRP